jgi:hypothetical protein
MMSEVVGVYSVIDYLLNSITNILCIYLGKILIGKTLFDDLLSLLLEHNLVAAGRLTTIASYMHGKNPEVVIKIL